jgi:hypothetical protein
MVHIKQLAPTIIDALNAVEQGCRRIQNDPNFAPEMSVWITVISDETCVGCLATCTLMQLANKTGKDILARFSRFSNPINVTDRASVYGIEENAYDENFTDFSFFEAALDSLRHSELLPLLKFYGLDQHPNAAEAIEWFNDTYTLGYGTQKRSLILYARFIKNKLLPRVQQWFC